MCSESPIWRLKLVVEIKLVFHSVADSPHDLTALPLFLWYNAPKNALECPESIWPEILTLLNTPIDLLPAVRGYMVTLLLTGIADKAE